MKIVEASLYATGIKGRDRKPKNHELARKSFPLEKVSDIPPQDLEDLKTEALELIKTKLKNPSRAYLHLQPMEIENHGDYSTKSFMCFTHTTINL